MRKKLVASFTSQTQEFQVSQAADAEAAATRLGLAIDILFADENAVLQIHQLFKYINADEAERPSAIILEAVKAEGFERLARNATTAGIGWISLNRHVPYLETLRAAHPDLPIGGVLADQMEAGRIQGRQILALLPRGGTVLHVRGPADHSVAKSRLRGTEEIVEDRAVTLSGVSGQWTEASGEKVVAGWLRLKTGTSERLDLVACQNDLMAVGARRALQQARADWAQIPVTGIDGLVDGGQRLVGRGEMAATVVMPFNAGRAVELVNEWVQTGIQPPEEVVQLPHSFPSIGDIAKRPTA